LDFKFENSSVVALFNKLNLGGCYFRVIKPGWVKPVSYMSLKAFGDEHISLYEAANIFKSPTKYEKRVKQIEKLSFVSNSWKELLINKYQLIKGGEKYVSSAR
jgi:MOSC domain-containing protein YiiM